MKYKINIDPGHLEDIISAYSESEEQDAHDLSLVITIQIGKDKRPKVEGIQLDGECTTEYIHTIK